MTVEQEHHDYANEYKSEIGEESSFWTFRRYSTTPGLTAEKIGRLISADFEPDGQLRMLDIGSGDGDFVKKLIEYLDTQLGFTRKMFINCIEPIKENIAPLQKTLASFPEQFSSQITQSTWQNFEASKEEPYDIILMSHVIYFFERDNEIEQVIEKAIECLKPNGILMIITRSKDEDYEFLEKFYEKAAEKPFNEKTIDDVKEIITSSILEKYPVQVDYRVARGAMVFPRASDSKSDFSKLMQFYFRRPWDDIDPSVQANIIEYIDGKHGQLRQDDGIILIRKSNIDQPDTQSQASLFTLEDGEESQI